jgi:hypothetical protein
MPIVNFEKETALLSEKELKLAVIVEEFFKLSPRVEGAKNIMTSQMIVNGINKAISTNFRGIRKRLGITPETPTKQWPRLSTIRLARIVNYLRSESRVFIAGSSKGYYRAVTDEEKNNAVTSLYQRITGMLAPIDGMERMGDYKDRDATFEKFTKTLVLFSDRRVSAYK